MRIVLWLLLPWLLFASELQIGDAIPAITFNDQYDKPHKLGNETVWVITWDRGTTQLANDYFVTHPSAIQAGRVAMIVDVSQTPSGIYNLFVLPRMQSYDYPIIMSFDEAYNREIPYKEGHVTLLFFTKEKLSKILYVDTLEGLESYMSQSD